MDEETFNYHENTNMSVMAYTSAAKGYFTKLFTNKDLSDKISSDMIRYQISSYLMS